MTERAPTASIHPSAQRLHGRFLFLDALRGIAAVSVALFHFNNEWASPTYREFSALLPDAVLAVWHRLDLGVEIFFVLSGFVIAHSMAGQRVDLRYAGNFILRRSIRLDPPYWLILAITMLWPYLLFPTLVSPPLMDPGFFEKFGGVKWFVINMFYLPNLLGQKTLVSVAWTLCLEVQFYLAYLTVLFLGHAAGNVWPHFRTRLIQVVFAILTLTSVAYWFTAPNTNATNTFIGRWWMFGSGVFIYMALRRHWSAWRAALALALLIATAITRHEPLAIAVAATAGVIYFVGVRGKLQSWLSWRWLQYLGRVSYSLYLVHWMVGIATLTAIQKFGDSSPTALTTGVVMALAMSLIAADLLNRTIEGPAARLAHRLRPKPVAAEIGRR